LVQLQDWPGSQLEWALFIPDVISNNLDSQVELAQAVLGLAPCDFNRIAQELRDFRVTMSIFGQGPTSLTFRFELAIGLGDHLTRNPLVLYLGIAVGEALTLFPELAGRHRDLAGPDDQLFKLIRHVQSSPSALSLPGPLISQSSLRSSCSPGRAFSLIRERKARRRRRNGCSPYKDTAQINCPQDWA
jgi:hypothetical protein